MIDARPDPDRLLAEVEAGEAVQHRGKLKIFFGACPGVGKTYAMLQALSQRRDEGVQILVGVVETHGRVDTERLLEGLPRLPSRFIEYKGRRLEEFDLDAALAAQPDLIAVDELAHTNVKGSRHRKRWQDVAELLEAGIDVCTTLNVQHLESLNAVVGRITGIVVRETVPDTVFADADDVVMVDIPADELLKRLTDGKVYLPDAAALAKEHFFRKGNLLALRELALRRAADRVNAQMRDYRRARAIGAVWTTRERLLVGVAGEAGDEQLLREAALLARNLDADWSAVHVDVLGGRRRGKQERGAIARTLTLADELGADAVTLSGTDVAETLATCARERNANRLMIGRRPRSRRQFWQRSTSDRVGQLDPEIAQIVIELAPAREVHRPVVRAPEHWTPYLWATLACFAVTLAATPLVRVFDLANVVMVFLLAVVLVALRLGRGPGAWSALLAVLCFDYFFVPPKMSLTVNDTQYVFTFVLMLGVALIIGQLTARLQHAARVTAARERRATALAHLARDLSGALTVEQVIEIALRSFTGFFQVRVGLALPDATDRVRAVAGSACAIDESVAQWSYDHGQPVGAGTDTLAAADARYVPLKAPMRVRGVLAIQPGDPPRLREPEEQRVLEACSSLVAQAFERVHFMEVAQRTLVQIEGERMRNTLLAAVSHDLRTPLTVIMGAAHAAARHTEATPAADSIALICEQAASMQRLIENLLDMARLQSSGVELDRQWHSLEEIIGSALRQLREPLARHRVHVALPPDFPLIEVDALLIERVLVNLLDNAAKYTPVSSAVEITVLQTHDSVVIRVSDDGPGLPNTPVDKLFEPFARGRSESTVAGIGLGLALARRILEAHGGHIEARSHAPHGATFSITLPSNSPPGIETP